MIFDSHMHVGSFESMFGVALDRDGMEELMRDNGIGNGVAFHPDNAYVADVVESIPGLYGLVWANPRIPGYIEEAARFLAHPKFLGMKMHPLLDGFHPNDPSVHPLIELLLERDLPVLIHCGHPIFTLPDGLTDAQVVKHCRERYGVMLSGSYGAGNLVRIGHMGPSARSLHPVVGLVAVGQTLADLGAEVDIGAGVEAALAELSQATAAVA